jgi:3'(2'), 5'-bisphosphate nucleotidase
MTYQREIAGAIGAVREAARLCRAVRAEIAPEVLAKRDQSPVTVADFGSQALICRALAGSFPDDPVIAEEDSAVLRLSENRSILDDVLWQVRAVRSLAESSGQGAAINRDKVCRWIDHGATDAYCPRFWTVDPIDGTKGFLRGGQYAVALALVVDGEVAVAALACPNLDAHDVAAAAGGDEPGREEDGGRARSTGAGRPAASLGSDSSIPLAGPGAVFFAIRGNGAFVMPCDPEPAAGPASLASAVRLRVSDRDDPQAVRFCESVEAGHSAHGDAATVAGRLGIVSPPLRMDSQAKYAVVARGQAEIYLRMPTLADYREKIWDHAAGALIVAEAGGVVSDIEGRALEFCHGRELVQNRGVIVTSGRLHERVLSAVRSVRG